MPSSLLAPSLVLETSVRVLRLIGLIIVVTWSSMVLLPGAGRAQTAATECTLAIEPIGSDGSGGIMVNDSGLTGIKVLDPSGQIILDKRITPAPPSRTGCHQHPPGQIETFNIPTPYTVPPNPPTPSIRFTATARDTAGHETTAIAEYWTE